ncbi:hypothetical protein QAD02_014280 [Eretmocerus hayati]|uniref:Uncharacterized protein n=1 Tax=Eretmocerus hayati TaxID=131215 RepID=A0ACC2P5U8_9HYME|nr:hypothetical protein QAD02_014280 [Eretmocerus hayati]
MLWSKHTLNVTYQLLIRNYKSYKLKGIIVEGQLTELKMRRSNPIPAPWLGALLILSMKVLCQAYPDGRSFVEPGQLTDERSIDIAHESTPVQATLDKGLLTVPDHLLKRDVSLPLKSINYPQARNARETSSIDEGSEDPYLDHSVLDMKILDDLPASLEQTIEEDPKNNESKEDIVDVSECLTRISNALYSSEFWNGIAQRLAQSTLPESLRSYFGFPANDILQIGDDGARQKREAHEKSKCAEPAQSGSYVGQIVQQFIPATVPKEKQVEMQKCVGDATTELQNLLDQFKSTCDNIREGFSVGSPSKCSKCQESYALPAQPCQHVKPLPPPPCEHVKVPPPCQDAKVIQSAPVLIQTVMENPEQIMQIPEIIQSSVPCTQVSDSLDKLKNSMKKIFGLFQEYDSQSGELDCQEEESPKCCKRKKLQKIHKCLQSWKSRKSCKSCQYHDAGCDEYSAQQTPNTIVVNVPTSAIKGPPAIAYPQAPAVGYNNYSPGYPHERASQNHPQYPAPLQYAPYSGPLPSPIAEFNRYPETKPAPINVQPLIPAPPAPLPLVAPVSPPPIVVHPQINQKEYSQEKKEILPYASEGGAYSPKPEFKSPRYPLAVQESYQGPLSAPYQPQYATQLNNQYQKSPHQIEEYHPSPQQQPPCYQHAEGNDKLSKYSPDEHHSHRQKRSANAQYVPRCTHELSAPLQILQFQLPQDQISQLASSKFLNPASMTLSITPCPSCGAYVESIPQPASTGYPQETYAGTLTQTENPQIAAPTLNYQGSEVNPSPIGSPQLLNTAQNIYNDGTSQSVNNPIHSEQYLGSSASSADCTQNIPILALESDSTLDSKDLNDARNAQVAPTSLSSDGLSSNIDQVTQIGQYDSSQYATSGTSALPVSGDLKLPSQSQDTVLEQAGTIGAGQLLSQNQILPGLDTLSSTTQISSEDSTTGGADETLKTTQSNLSQCSTTDAATPEISLTGNPSQSNQNEYQPLRQNNVPSTGQTYPQSQISGNTYASSGSGNPSPNADAQQAVVQELGGEQLVGKNQQTVPTLSSTNTDGDYGIVGNGIRNGALVSDSVVTTAEPLPNPKGENSQYQGCGSTSGSPLKSFGNQQSSDSNLPYNSPIVDLEEDGDVTTGIAITSVSPSAEDSFGNNLNRNGGAVSNSGTMNSESDQGKGSNLEALIDIISGLSASTSQPGSSANNSHMSNLGGALGPLLESLSGVSALSTGSSGSGSQDGQESNLESLIDIISGLSSSTSQPGSSTNSSPLTNLGGALEPLLEALSGISSISTGSSGSGFQNGQGSGLEALASIIPGLSSSNSQQGSTDGESPLNNLGEVIGALVEALSGVSTLSNSGSAGGGSQDGQGSNLEALVDIISSLSSSTSGTGSSKNNSPLGNLAGALEPLLEALSGVSTLSNSGSAGSGPQDGQGSNLEALIDILSGLSSSTSQPGSSTNNTPLSNLGGALEPLLEALSGVSTLSNSGSAGSGSQDGQGSNLETLIDIISGLSSSTSETGSSKNNSPLGNLAGELEPLLKSLSGVSTLSNSGSAGSGSQDGQGSNLEALIDILSGLSSSTSQPGSSTNNTPLSNLGGALEPLLEALSGVSTLSNSGSAGSGSQDGQGSNLEALIDILSGLSSSTSQPGSSTNNTPLSNLGGALEPLLEALSGVSTLSNSGSAGSGSQDGQGSNLETLIDIISGLSSSTSETGSSKNNSPLGNLAGALEPLLKSLSGVSTLSNSGSAGSGSQDGQGSNLETLMDIISGLSSSTSETGSSMSTSPLGNLAGALEPLLEALSGVSTLSNSGSAGSGPEHGQGSNLEALMDIISGLSSSTSLLGSPDSGSSLGNLGSTAETLLETLSKLSSSNSSPNGQGSNIEALTEIISGLSTSMNPKPSSKSSLVGSIGDTTGSLLGTLSGVSGLSNSGLSPSLGTGLLGGNIIPGNGGSFNSLPESPVPNIDSIMRMVSDLPTSIVETIAQQTSSLTNRNALPTAANIPQNPIEFGTHLANSLLPNVPTLDKVGREQLNKGNLIAGLPLSPNSVNVNSYRNVASEPTGYVETQPSPSATESVDSNQSPLTAALTPNFGSSNPTLIGSVSSIFDSAAVVANSLSSAMSQIASQNQQAQIQPDSEYPESAPQLLNPSSVAGPQLSVTLPREKICSALNGEIILPGDTVTITINPHTALVGRVPDFVSPVPLRLIQKNNIQPVQPIANREWNISGEKCGDLLGRLSPSL